MSIESEVDPFAYGSSMYGGRPTFALTRRLRDDAGLTLYEFMPEDIANGRQERLRRANSNRTLRQLPISEALPDVTEDSVGQVDFTEVGSQNEKVLSNWEWDTWCALKITTLRGKRQRAIQHLVKSVLNEENMNVSSVTRGEGSAVFSENGGIRLAIAFLALKDLRKYEKLTTVADSIGRMSLEECYYWHAKCRSPGTNNGIIALRVLLTHHIG